MRHQHTTSSPAHCSVALATAAELEHTRGFTGSPDYRASRLAASRAVRAALPGVLEIRIRRRTGAAPAVIGTAQPIALSLTHCDGRAAAIAAPAPARIGIDLEREDTISPDHARYFLTIRERAALGTHSLAALWALKEAAWKALALPGDTRFHDLELAMNDAGTVEAVSTPAQAFSASATLATPWPGYVLATIRVAEGTPAVHDFSEAAR